MPDPRPLLAISLGDPLGIGPEITIKALADPALRRRARFHLFGSLGPLPCPPDWTRLPVPLPLAPPPTSAPPTPTSAPPPPTPPDADIVFFDLTPQALSTPTPTTTLTTPPTPWPAPTTPEALKLGGDLSFRAFSLAIDALQRDHPHRAHALVTAPIAKEAWHAAGHRWPGHTEVLAHRFAPTPAHPSTHDAAASLSTPDPGSMLFVGPTLRVILATIHLPLARVSAALSTPLVERAITTGHHACRALGLPAPRIAVAGLNPHAGEHGLFGHEDADIIAPAVAHARDRGIDARGPLPGDTVFAHAAAGHFDLVVAMYHDQGLIPVKLLDRWETVNVTAGLSWQGHPVIRTSPAHGTAFDIAGRDRAQPRSMTRAIELALHMLNAATPAAPRA